MEGTSISKPKFFKEYKFILPVFYFLITTALFYILEPSGYFYYIEDFLNWLPTKWLSDYILASGARDHFAINFIFYVLILYLIKKSVFKYSVSRLSKISIFSFAIPYSVIVGFFYQSGFHNFSPPIAFMFTMAQILSMPGVYFQHLFLGNPATNLFANFWQVYANSMVAILLPWLVLGLLIDGISNRVRNKNSQAPVGF